jgi:hypothetical protein
MIMNRRMFVGFFGLFCLMLWRVAAIAQPQIQINGNAKYDFGTLFQGEKAEVTFEVKNVGTDTLLITSVETSCGCTAALASADKILPNGTAKISATFNSTAFYGPISKHVYVRSNDVKNPQVEFEITGTVAVEIELLQAYFIFEDAMVGKTTKASVTLKNVSSKPITLVGVENTYETVKIDFKKTTIPAGFKITEQSLKNLKSESLPDDVLKKLQTLKDRYITGEKEFSDILKTTIGNEQTLKFLPLLLKHASVPNTFTLNATMTPKEPGVVFGSIKVLTDSDRQTAVEVKIYANVLEAPAPQGAKK